MPRMAPLALCLVASASLAAAFTPSLVQPLRSSPSSQKAASSALAPMMRPAAASRLAPLRPSSALSLSMAAASSEAGGGLGLTHQCADGTKITYDFIPASNPTILYLPGLGQTRYDSKFSALQSWCKRNNYGYLVADYYGCGQSGGDPKKGCITRWTADTLSIIKNVIKGPVVLCGSGVGGWVMMQVAVQNPKAVVGCVGVAADPDFTTDLVIPSLSKETLDKIDKDGAAEITWGKAQYTLSKVFIDDAEKNLLMKGGPGSLKVTCPVRLVQGLGDIEIPPERALTLCDVLATEDVVVTYAKFGDHVLDEDDDTRLVTSHLADLASQYFEFDLKSPSSG